MFDHIQIKVDNLALTRSFYEATFKSLGYRIVFEVEGTVGFGTSLNEMFKISQADAQEALSKAVHVAVAADGEAAVRMFYATALAHEATDNGPPALRPRCDAGYFAAFVIDPNGHNLEAVCHLPKT